MPLTNIRNLLILRSAECEIGPFPASEYHFFSNLLRGLLPALQEWGRVWPLDASAALAYY